MAKTSSVPAVLTCAGVAAGLMWLFLGMTWQIAPVAAVIAVGVILKGSKKKDKK